MVNVTSLSFIKIMEFWWREYVAQWYALDLRSKSPGLLDLNLTSKIFQSRAPLFAFPYTPFQAYVSILYIEKIGSFCLPSIVWKHLLCQVLFDFHFIVDFV